MSAALRTAEGLVTGFLLGLIVVVLACLGALMSSWWASAPVSLPFMIDAAPAPGGGAAGVEFVPHGAGMKLVIAVCTMACGVAALVGRRRSRAGATRSASVGV